MRKFTLFPSVHTAEKRKNSIRVSFFRRTNLASAGIGSDVQPRPIRTLSDISDADAPTPQISPKQIPYRAIHNHYAGEGMSRRRRFTDEECRGLRHEHGVKKYLMATSYGAGPSKYYVYLLVDPRNGLPFYVGKGKGDRCKHHKREALEGRRGARYAVIREILIAGLQVEIRKVKWFDDRREALEYETSLIWTIGPKNLTNKALGVLSARQA